MFTLKRTTSEDPDFIQLVSFLDTFLAEIDGPDHAFYAQFNHIDTLRHAVVVYDGEMAVGCGAFKKLDSRSAEIKRMYTAPEYRGKGVASLILKELELWANELGYKYTILETGLKQQDAIRLYQKNGYIPTDNYGPYAGVPNSVCFTKTITDNRA